MPAGTILGGLMGEVKQHPWTTVSAMIALAGVVVMFPNYLSAQSVAQRVERIETTQQQQIRETLMGRLGALRSAQFDIQARIDEIRGRGQVPDQIFFNELKRLGQEIDTVERQLADM